MHPYLGLAAMETFVSRAVESGGCVLVVTRSSNREGRVIQEAVAGGATVEQRLLAEIGALNAGLAPGEIGPVGAVVSPVRELPGLDLTAANCLYLAPGVGAQGVTPADVAAVFAACPDRVMPSASRSLLAAGPDVGRLRDAVSALAAEFRWLRGC